LLRPFPDHAQLAGLHAEAVRVERAELARAKARRVEELEDRAVAEALRLRRVGRGEKRFELVRVHRPRETPVELRAREADRRVGRGPIAAAPEAVEGAEGGELARHGALGGAAPL